MNLGQRLRELRAERGLSQEALADALSVSRQTVSKWETGAVHPSADNLARLSQVYGLSVDALLRGGPAVPPPSELEEPEEPVEPPQARQSGRRRTARLTALALMILALEVVIAVVSSQSRAGGSEPAPTLSLGGMSGSAAAGLRGYVPAFADLPPERLAALDPWRFPALWDLIMDARAQFIYGSQGWTVDGVVCVIDLETGEAETLPEFSDLFPGWEVPSASLAAPNDPTTLHADEKDWLTMIGPAGNPLTAEAREDAFDRSVNALFRRMGDWMSDEIFATIIGNGNTFAVFPQTDPMEGARGNLKVLNRTQGLEAGWAPNLPKGQGVLVRTVPGTYYGFNGSAFRPDDEGWRSVRFTDDPGIAGVQ